MHNVSSDEEEPLAAGLVIGGQRIAPGAIPSGAAGIEPASAESAEEESAYHFRRSKSTQYHRVGVCESLYVAHYLNNCTCLQPLVNRVGNWPWETVEDYGTNDPKYRFTLTSLRQER